MSSFRCSVQSSIFAKTATSQKSEFQNLSIPELAPTCRPVTARVRPRTASVGGERDVAVVQHVSTDVIQVGLVADLKVVRYAASGQVRVGLQRDCLEVPGEGNGRGYYVVRHIAQREAGVRVERRRTHSLAEHGLKRSVHGNIRLSIGWV